MGQKNKQNLKSLSPDCLILAFYRFFNIAIFHVFISEMVITVFLSLDCMRSCVNVLTPPLKKPALHTAFQERAPYRIVSAKLSGPFAGGHGECSEEHRTDGPRCMVLTHTSLMMLFLPHSGGIRCSWKPTAPVSGQVPSLFGPKSHNSNLLLTLKGVLKFSASGLQTGMLEAVQLKCPLPRPLKTELNDYGKGLSTRRCLHPQ